MSDSIKVLFSFSMYNLSFCLSVCLSLSFSKVLFSYYLSFSHSDFLSLWVEFLMITWLRIYISLQSADIWWVWRNWDFCHSGQFFSISLFLFSLSIYRFFFIPFYIDLVRVYPVSLFGFNFNLNLLYNNNGSTQEKIIIGLITVPMISLN